MQLDYMDAVDWMNQQGLKCSTNSLSIQNYFKSSYISKLFGLNQWSCLYDWKQWNINIGPIFLNISQKNVMFGINLHCFFLKETIFIPNHAYFASLQCWKFDNTPKSHMTDAQLFLANPFSTMLWYCATLFPCVISLHAQLNPDLLNYNV